MKVKILLAIGLLVFCIICITALSILSIACKPSDEDQEATHATVLIGYKGKIAGGVNAPVTGAIHTSCTNTSTNETFEKSEDFEVLPDNDGNYAVLSSGFGLEPGSYLFQIATNAWATGWTYSITAGNQYQLWFKYGTQDEPEILVF